MNARRARFDTCNRPAGDSHNDPCPPTSSVSATMQRPSTFTKEERMTTKSTLAVCTSSSSPNVLCALGATWLTCAKLSLPAQCPQHTLPNDMAEAYTCTINVGSQFCYTFINQEQEYSLRTRDRKAVLTSAAKQRIRTAPLGTPQQLQGRAACLLLPFHDPEHPARLYMSRYVKI